MRPTVLDTDAYVSIAQSCKWLTTLNGTALALFTLAENALFCGCPAVLVARSEGETQKMKHHQPRQNNSPVALRWTSMYPNVVVLLELLQLASKNVLKV